MGYQNLLTLLNHLDPQPQTTPPPRPDGWKRSLANSVALVETLSQELSMASIRNRSLAMNPPESAVSHWLEKYCLDDWDTARADYQHIHAENSNFYTMIADNLREKVTPLLGELAASLKVRLIERPHQQSHQSP